MRFRLGVLITFFSMGCATAPRDSGKLGLLDRMGGQVSRQATADQDAGTDSATLAKTGSISGAGTWRWPLDRVEISSKYGPRGRRFHRGIDLRAEIGTPVKAVDHGVVIYVGSKIRGYGRMVVLRHEGGIYTVYAHHSKNLVKKGQTVKQGQVIASSGRTGRAHGAHLHFEVRQGPVSIDPEAYLQKRML